MAQYSSSPSLSSPPSGSISDPTSPSRLSLGRAKVVMNNEIIVDIDAGARFGLVPQSVDESTVALTASGAPRKKPGRKPGAAAAAKKAADEGTASATDAPKQRRQRKPKDPNAPPVSRKRKAPPTDIDGDPDRDARSFSTGPDPMRQAKITELASMRMDLDPPSRPQQPAQHITTAAPRPPNRDSMPGSMRNILNHDPPQPSQVSTPPPPPPRTSGQSYDPVRSANYDPVRETMVARDPYGTGPLGSPRAPSHMNNRASTSPSIASLVDPAPTTNLRSPHAAQNSYGRQPDSTSTPDSPSNAVRNAAPDAQAQPPPKPAPLFATDADVKPAPTAKETKKEAVITEPSKATKRQSTGAAKASSAAKSSTAKGAAAKASTSKAASKVTKGADEATRGSPPVPTQDVTAALGKKVTSMVLQERKNQKGSSTSSSPKMSSIVAMPPVPDFPYEDNERSILDFGKANPADKKPAPSIILTIPLNGETNKYVNFMRMAEDKYGWDALHPREAAHRDRKARIAAAASALEKNGAGRETGDEETDQESDAENSNGENKNGNGAGLGDAGGDDPSGPDGAPAKKARKKRNCKEDEYDRDDDFVDDSEMLWEEQAAASKDGFFVYSGPLVPEVEKPPPGSEAPKRGRGGGRGSRGGGRGGAARGGTTGRGRGGGPGSRGGTTTRKPRMTKVEKEALEREKLAAKAGVDEFALNPSTEPNPPFSAMVIDI